jgi:inositol hexakisphosphate/diphosphoinositol-pentakisphosphate kinase
MDVKARSKPMREIMTRILQRGQVEVKIFGDKVILDEGITHPSPVRSPCLLNLNLYLQLDVENWPRCDILISFFSTGFPLARAVEYVKLHKPVCVNDLLMQALLWDRRCVLALLDHLKVPTPRRLVVSRDGGPKLEPELARQVEASLGIVIQSSIPAPEVSMRADGDAIIVDGVEMEKPFVEKPVSGEDHNVYIYFKGGGGRRLFRKVHPGHLSKYNLLT